MALKGAAAWVDATIAWASSLSGAEIAFASGVTAAAFGIAWIARQALGRIVIALFSKARDRAQQVQDGPGVETIDRSESLVRKLIVAGLLLAATVISLEAWGLDTLGWLVRETRAVDAGAGVLVVLVVATLAWLGVAVVVDFLVTPRVGRQKMGPEAREQTVAQLLISVGRFAVVVIAILLILAEIGLNIAPLIAGAGIVGLAVGFGAQSLVKDVLTGFMVVLEESLTVGDFVAAAGHRGKVERLGVRSLKLRAIDGTLHIVPYGEIKTIENMTRDFGFAVVDVGIAYHQDIDRCLEVMRSVGADLVADPALAPSILEPVEVLGVEALRDTGVILRARIKTRPFDRWSVARAFNTRLKQRFEEVGIAFAPAAAPAAATPPPTR
jgi:small conductance mechanosensitive channel